MPNPLDPAQLQVFLDAAAATPEADAPRLVLADWLQERGPPWASWGELIAVQCALTRISPRAPERVGLLRAQHRLLRTRAWWPFDGTGFHADTFVRGLPSAVRVRSPSAIRALPSWLHADDLAIPMKRADLRELVAIDELKTSGLRFELDHAFADTQMFLFWASRIGLALRRFTLVGKTHRAALDPLLRGLGQHLEELVLVDPGTNIRDAWEELPRLRKLVLRRASVFGFLPEVAARLEDVEISGVTLERRLPDLLRPLRRLTRLALSRVGLDDEGLRSMLDFQTHTLRALDVSHNQLGRESFERLARQDLDELDVRHTGLTPRDAEVLARSSRLPNTLTLRISTAEAGAALPALRERFAVVIT